MKITFLATPCIPPEQVQRNTERTRTLGLPFWSKSESGALAIVGRGQSAKDQASILRMWPGKIWAINGAVHWCRAEGIEATLFTSDPHPDLVPLTPGVRRALLSLACDPQAYDALISQGAAITTFETGAWGIPTGCTTATTALHLALQMGFSTVDYFGCEGNYRYGDERPASWMRVSVAGKEFDTKSEYLMQSRYLAEHLREFPTVYRDRSGGLLQACIADGDWSLVCVSQVMREGLNNSRGVPVCPIS